LEAARHAGKIDTIASRAAKKLGEFVALFDRLAASLGGPLEETLGFVLNETGYHAMLRESESEEDLDRLANIEELLTVARDFDERSGGTGQIEAFLEETCLVNDTDAWEVEADRVTLMTLHASKGLEFPVVYLTAVEEGLLPHERSREHPEQLEEERRLMFVGITRAQQELQMSMASYRDFRGQRKRTIPSSFLMELPRGEMDMEYAGAAGGGSLDLRDYLDFGPDALPPEEAYGEQASAEDALSHADPFVDISGTAALNATPQATGDSPAFHLKTAAEMANEGVPLLPVNPDIFRQGMLVRHPAIGLGRIVALSGSGLSRRATVDFASSAGRKSYVLSKSPLRPVKTE
jgi:DNA helicase-2/ATP-dependent DNA helicase PcrA